MLSEIETLCSMDREATGKVCGVYEVCCYHTYSFLSLLVHSFARSYSCSFAIQSFSRLSLPFLPHQILLFCTFRPSLLLVRFALAVSLACLHLALHCSSVPLASANLLGISFLICSLPRLPPEIWRCGDVSSKNVLSN